VVTRLRDAGAVILGKLSLHEFAGSGPAFDLPWPPARNPWNPSLGPGGSSSGAGVAVAAGLAMAALGTDTAGSIRIPASYCGVVGFKPTFGAVPTAGVFPLVPWMDHVGPIAADVATCADAFATLAGVARLTPAIALAGLRIGVPRDVGHVERSIQAAVDAALARCREAGAVLVPFEHSTPPGSSLMLRQCAVAFVHRGTYPSRRGEYGTNVQAKIDRGHDPFSHLEALAARAELDAWKVSYAAATVDVDVIAMATVPISPPPIDVDELAVRGAATSHTAPFNLLGWASLTLPCGRDASGLPVGLMLSAPSDDAVLGIASAVERLVRR
jgi:aspartyl-tRNA(Asn)/glutamyl-tRNA(Gln) amidotransferase subunit A